MKEGDLFEPLIEYLKNNGYTIIEQNRNAKHGPDIIAKKEDKTYRIEIKGDQKNKTNRFFQNTGKVILQSLKEKHIPCVAYPKESYNKLFCDYKTELNELGIHVFLITENKQVDEH